MPDSSAHDAAVSGDLPDGNWPPVPLCGVVELRVHGVGGTPPADMLDDPAPRQVSGDRMAGVWRGTAPPDAAGGPDAVDAYSWGGLTERALGAALWLVVLPFALVNVAGWMPPRRGGTGHGLHRGVVRLAGLALTALYVVFAAVIGMDFLSYQCAARVGCAASGWWVIGTGGIADDAARRVVVGAALPVLVVLGLALLTFVSRRRYERWRLDPQAPVHPSSSDDPTEVGLVSPHFWTGQGYAAHLADIHLFVGFGLVAMLLGTTAETTTTAPAAPMLVWLNVGLLALAAVAGSVTRVRRRIPPHLAPVGGILLVLAAALVAWTGAPLPPPAAAPLPGVLPTFGAVVGIFLGAAVVLLGVGWFAQRDPTDWAVRLRRTFTPFALLVFGGLVGTSVLAGTALWVAGTVGERYSVGDPSRTAHAAAILYPQPFEALARSQLPVVGLALVAALIAAAIVGRRNREEIETGLAHLRAQYADDTADVGGLDASVSTAWEKGVRRALGLPARMQAGAEVAVWTLAATSWLAAVAYGVFWFAHGSDPGAAQRRYDDLATLWFLPPLPLSIFLLTLLPLGAVWVVRQSLRRSALRRHVGVAWDLATFWPRSFHPLSPPCYAERAVPETQARMLRIWAAGGAVDLQGHSQGAVLVAAAVVSLPPDRLPPPGRLALITYGNPLMRLYARYFPCYVDAGLVRKVGDRVSAGWTNPYRDTDPIGDVVGEPAVDVWLPDPATNRYFAGDLEPRIRGHAERDYRRQTLFVAEVALATAALRPLQPCADDVPAPLAPATGHAQAVRRGGSAGASR